jgi:hypothetical protein
VKRIRRRWTERPSRVFVVLYRLCPLNIASLSY